MKNITRANKATLETLVNDIKNRIGVDLPKLMQARTAEKLRAVAEDHSMKQDFVDAGAAERIPCRATLVRYGILDATPEIFEWWYLEGEPCEASTTARAEYHLTRHWRARIQALLIAYKKA